MKTVTIIMLYATGLTTLLFACYLHEILGIRSDYVWLIFSIGMMLFFAGFFVAYTDASYIDGYRNGQIDAINGQIHFHLQINKDGSTSWVEIPKQGNINSSTL